jgi:hypothetical protein
LPQGIQETKGKAMKAEWIKEIAKDIQDAGYRVFISEDGTFGFYTDAEGSRLVSFGIDLLSVRFSGNYKTSDPRKTGTGWRIGENRTDYQAMFDAPAPTWATKGVTWEYTTLAEHLDRYAKCCGYAEQAKRS